LLFLLFSGVFRLCQFFLQSVCQDENALFPAYQLQISFHPAAILAERAEKTAALPSFWLRQEIGSVLMYY